MYYYSIIRIREAKEELQVVIQVMMPSSGSRFASATQINNAV